MNDIIIPSESVAEVAALLHRPARDLVASDIVNALRHRSEPGKDWEDAGEYSAVKVAQMKELESLLQPIHDVVGRRLTETLAGRRIVTARQELEEGMKKVDERARGEGGDRRVATHEKALLLDQFRQEHGAGLLAVAAEHAELLPSLELIQRGLRPSVTGPDLTWKAEALPYRGVLIQAKVDEDGASTGQGLSSPEPPATINTCLWPPFPFQYTHEDSAAVGNDFVLGANEVSGFLQMEPAVWPPGSVSARALVGGQAVAVPAGPYSYEVEIDFGYHYNASCWAFMSVAGTGADLMIEIDTHDGKKATHFSPLFTLHSYLAGGVGASESAARTLRYPFTRDGSQPGEISIMAGIAAHAEAGGSPLSGYAGVNLWGEVKKICLKTL